MASICSLLLAVSFVIGFFAIKARIARSREDQTRSKNNNWGGGAFSSRLVSLLSSLPAPPQKPTQKLTSSSRFRVRPVAATAMTDRSTTNGPGPDTKSKHPQIPVNPLNKNNQLSSSMFGATTMGSSMDGGGDDYADAEREAREERIDAGQSRSVCSFFLFFVSFLLPFATPA